MILCLTRDSIHAVPIIDSFQVTSTLWDVTTVIDLCKCLSTGKRSRSSQVAELPALFYQGYRAVWCLRNNQHNFTKMWKGKRVIGPNIWRPSFNTTRHRRPLDWQKYAPMLEMFCCPWSDSAQIVFRVFSVKKKPWWFVLVSVSFAAPRPTLDTTVAFPSAVAPHHVERPLCHYSLTSMNEAPQ